MGAPFVRHELLTLDVEEARRFYGDTLGTPPSRIRPLPERARALGAPPNWLNHIAVADLAATTARAAELGAQVLGPRRVSEDGEPFAILRDPEGAVLSVQERAGVPLPEAPAPWLELHVRDVDRAFGFYAALFDWSPEPEEVTGAPGVRYRVFSTTERGWLRGAITDLARNPRVATHWLRYFAVPDLSEACWAVRHLGGVVHGPYELGGLGEIAACDDSQGAAFGLIQG